MEDLLKVAEIACEAAVRAGADFADASGERGRGLSVSVEKNATKSSDALLWASISVRAFSDGGTGWSSLSGLSEDTARQAGRQAAELAKAAEPDPDFTDLVHPAAYPEVDGIYDPAIAEATAAEVAGWVTCNIDAARSVAADAVVSGDAHAGWRLARWRPEHSSTACARRRAQKRCSGRDRSWWVRRASRSPLGW